MQKPVEAAWNAYRQKLIRDAVAVPLKEARAAFYSGFSEAFRMIMSDTVAAIEAEVSTFERSVEKEEEREA